MTRTVYVLQHDDDVSVYATLDLAVAAVVEIAGEDSDPEELAGLDDGELTRWSFESLGGRVLPSLRPPL